MPPDEEPVAGSPADASLHDLATENQLLKEKLLEYKRLEEELMAQRVYENAKKKLMTWLTLGGIGTLLLTFIGFKQVENYIQQSVKKKVDTVTEQKVGELIQKHIAATVTAKNEYIITQINEAVGKYVASQRLSLVASSASNTGGEMLVLEPLKPAVDYSEYMGPVGNQVTEGSVVGFAVAAALEYQIFKTTNTRVRISPRYIYYAARLMDGTNKADSGAKISNAVEVLRKQGAVPEEAWPYKAGEFADDPPKAVQHAKRYRISASRSLKSVDEVKAALQRFGPVVTGITLYQSGTEALGGPTGIVPLPSSKESILGGHAICIVGYDDQRKRFKFKNSWGAETGDHGYGYISYEYFEKFAADSWAITL